MSEAYVVDNITEEKLKPRDSFNVEFTENCDSEEITFRNPNETRHLGSCRAFFYYKGDPLVIIGPDCKILSQKIIKI